MGANWKKKPRIIHTIHIHTRLTKYNSSINFSLPLSCFLSSSKAPLLASHEISSERWANIRYRIQAWGSNAEPNTNPTNDTKKKSNLIPFGKIDTCLLTVLHSNSMYLFFLSLFLLGKNGELNKNDTFYTSKNISIFRESFFLIVYMLYVVCCIVWDSFCLQDMHDWHWTTDDEPHSSTKKKLVLRHRDCALYIQAYSA